MFIDARHEVVPDRPVQACVIGGGPAGLALASELGGAGLDVLLLESGGRSADPDIQSLNDGECEGDPYSGLRHTRSRGLGGTSLLWNTPSSSGSGAKYVPLSAVDFRDRPGQWGGGWPLALHALEVPYERAQTICGLGPYRYGDQEWSGARRPLALPDGLVGGVYQFGGADPFRVGIPQALGASPNVQVVHHATVTHLEGERGGVRRAWVRTEGRAPFSVQAETFVAAAGAVENARLLLNSPGPDGVPLGNHSGQVGRCFMEHPRDRSLTLDITEDDVFESLGFYDLHAAADGTWICGRVGLSEDAVLEGGLPNASVTLLPLLRLSLRRRSVLSRLAGTLRLRRPIPEGHGWFGQDQPSRVYGGLQLLINTEQGPHAENRVTLGSDCDRFGTPLPRLRWRWRPEEIERQHALRRWVAERFTALGLGSVRVDESAGVDPNAHHHAGTTRMSHDPAHGVTDVDGRVHGTENLFMAGASLFPSAGFANPTLTIVALAVKLADELKARLGS